YQVQIESINQEISIMADVFALELVMKNLLENTRVHTNSQKVTIGIIQLQKSIILKYQDEGNFNGEKSKLGTLFYKHNSTKGSGIGLYLSDKLMRKMKGKLLIQGSNKLIFELVFQTNEVENA
ncbi:MAG: ATP-binding protein, partial [Pseudomonadota bacterium]